MFLAVIYFVVGQAAALRGSAQTAADAAALAAAQDARYQLREGWLSVILVPSQWSGFLEGKKYFASSACEQANVFAARNGAQIPSDGCIQLAAGREGFTVTVRTTGTVGSSVVPGTESRQAAASATAVIEPKCHYEAPEVPTQAEPTPAPDPTEPDEEPDPEEEPILGLTCDGDAWTIDPEDPTLPSASELFSVRLTGDDE